MHPNSSTQLPQTRKLQCRQGGSERPGAGARGAAVGARKLSLAGPAPSSCSAVARRHSGCELAPALLCVHWPLTCASGAAAFTAVGPAAAARPARPAPPSQPTAGQPNATQPAQPTPAQLSQPSAAQLIPAQPSPGAGALGAGVKVMLCSHSRQRHGNSCTHAVHWKLQHTPAGTPAAWDNWVGLVMSPHAGTGAQPRPGYRSGAQRPRSNSKIRLTGEGRSPASNMRIASLHAGHIHTGCRRAA
jgi:hypothetical protein